VDRSTTLQQALRAAGISQSELARRSGVPQGRISDYVNRKFEPSTVMFDRLMSALGMTAHVTVTPTGMQRTEIRSWLLHRLIADKLRGGINQDDWDLMRHNLDHVRLNTSGASFNHCLNKWDDIIDQQNLGELISVLTDISPNGVAMREVSPMTGFLTEDERLGVLTDIQRSRA